MKLFLFIVFSCVLSNTYAQEHFYFKPIFSYKWGISSSSPSHFNTSVINPSPLYNYKNYTVIGSQSFLPSNIGFAVGYKFSDKFSFDIEASTDESLSGCKIDNLVYDPTFNVTINSQTKYSNGRSFGKLLGNTSFTIYKTQNQLLKFDLGLGLAFRSGKNSLDKLDYEQNTHLIDNQNSTITISNYVLKNNKTSFLLKFGFSDDFYFNKLRLFTLSAFYLHSSRMLTTVISDVNIQTTYSNNIGYSSTSKGSGFYIQISRTFFPFLKTKVRN